MEEGKISYYSAVGRRKTSIARVRLVLGKGKIEVNKKDIDKYFSRETLIRKVSQPLNIVNSTGSFDITAILRGGGHSGQAEAMAMGISRALIKYDATLRPVLKKAGLLRRDSRGRERKKYGQRGARRRFQFSKR